jgi:hypothetical protein
MMIKQLSLLIMIFLNAFLIAGAQEEEIQLTWPREIETENKTVVTLYQPQLESFEDNVLIGRMAVSVKPLDIDLSFGALWFSAYLTTDLEKRIVTLDRIDITQTHFPEVDEDKVAAFMLTLEEAVAGAGIEMSLDRLLASLEVAEVYHKQSANLDNNPPEIYFRTVPAILIYIDGEPFLQDTEESGIQYVANTPYFLVKYDKTEAYYLKVAKWWYTSKQVSIGWESTKDVPGKVEKLAKKSIDDEGIEQDSLLMAMKQAPELIVSTVPAELISTDGDPKYTPIQGTSLLYVDNSENDIIMDITSQKHYILLAGRWYSSRTLHDGDWTFAEPKSLPEDFSKIPTESPMANVRTSVPGTDEANIAVLEQTIPQTATVDRKTATVEVNYDGEPQFKAIEGTSMYYAVNCDKSVIMVEKTYYCVDNGIWFESAMAKGPWVVSTVRPEGVEEIPAESPVYNVKYVYIYDYTPEVVYVGYTPGYTCSYVYGGVVVYGTGYYYRPWYGHYYYPRPVTYGFGVHYNPWTGWGFYAGPSFAMHYHAYGMWGPRGYYPGYRAGYGHGYRHGYNHGYYNGARAGYAAGQRNAYSNVYRNHSNGVITGGSQRPPRGNASQLPAGNTGRQQVQARNNAATNNNAGRGSIQNNTRPSTKENNVFTDRNGNVQRRDQNGNWESRSNGQWQQQQPSTREQQPTRQQPSTREQQPTRQQQPASRQPQNTQQLNREYQSRQQGTQRQNTYNSSRSQSTSRSSGSTRSSGGGRRR